MYRVIRFVMIAVAGGFMIAATFIILFQYYMILPSLSFDPLEESPPEGIQVVRLSSAEHVELNVWKVAGEPDMPFSGWALVFFHGNGDLVRNSINQVKAFRDLGFSGFVMDYRGTGASSGWPTEELLYRDSEALLSYVQTEGFLPEQTVAVGSSFGTRLASYIAAHSNLPAVALVSPYLSIPEVISDRGILGVLRPFVRFKLPTQEHLSRFRGSCVLIVYGGKDTTITPRHALHLLNQFKGPTKFISLEVPEAGHYDIFSRALGSIKDQLQECLLTTD